MSEYKEKLALLIEAMKDRLAAFHEQRANLLTDLRKIDAELAETQEQLTVLRNIQKNYQCPHSTIVKRQRGPKATPATGQLAEHIRSVLKSSGKRLSPSAVRDSAVGAGIFTADDKRAIIVVRNLLEKMVRHGEVDRIKESNGWTWYQGIHVNVEEVQKMENEEAK